MRHLFFEREPFMPLMLAALLLVASVSILVFFGRHEARVAAAARHRILDPSLNVLEAAKVEIDACDFPKMEGKFRGRSFRVALVPDTLTFRRLPQLWLDVTLKRSLPVDGSVAILVRQSGADYFSLTDHLNERLAPPENFPDVCLIKGDGPGARHILDRIAPYVASLLRDPHFKEIAITPRGIRIMRQLAEGKRGDHLILRQIVFEGARLNPEELEDVIAAVLEIETLLLNVKLVSAA
ncbi:hypothetical protein HYPDE_35753 [Hyphomicrobium denitrificans 1NES1]|uniref:Uncharacterized protein n=2 Tax=Hyphomicrobium denitrificans TaxID=53399 RepID=N0B969_9HYPH|nr:hypothetical protein HYPDE_35753 [Hyphomicrobium denitrificans 1NES1]